MGPRNGYTAQSHGTSDFTHYQTTIFRTGPNSKQLQTAIAIKCC